MKMHLSHQKFIVVQYQEIHQTKKTVHYTFQASLAPFAKETPCDSYITAFVIVQTTPPSALIIMIYKAQQTTRSQPH